MIATRRSGRTGLRDLVGSGDKIALVTLPFAFAGLVANIAFPTVFSVGGPPDLVRAVAAAVLAIGVVVWAWCVVLILANVPRGRLITAGPYAVVLHPLYTSVALLVLPSLGLALNSWLGAAVGLVMYAAARYFAPEEEHELAARFGAAWTEYRRHVAIRWL